MTVKKQKRNVSEEERERRRERAIQMHEQVVVDPETGEERRKFGGPQPNSGPKKRVGASVKEYAEGNVDDIVSALARGLGSPNADTARRSAEAILKHARREEQDEVEERRGELEQNKRDAILGRILQRLEGGRGSGEVVLDGDFTEIEDAELDGPDVESRALPAPSD